VGFGWVLGWCYGFSCFVWGFLGWVLGELWWGGVVGVGGGGGGGGEER